MSRARGPLGALTVAVTVGVGTGLVATHLILAAWTYRDASRRGVPRGGTWALAVLVGGVFAFLPYLLVQGTGRSLEGGLLGSLVDLGRALWGPVRWCLGATRRLLGLGGDAAGLVGRVARGFLRAGRAVGRILGWLDRPDGSTTE